MQYPEFLPLETPPKTYPLGAFDVEGDAGDKGFQGAAAYTEKGQFWSTDPAKLIEYMGSREYRKTRFYSHNLGYDMGVLLPYLKMPWHVYLINGDLYRGYIHHQEHRDIRVHDSASLLYWLSISQLGKTMGFPKWETPPSLRDDDTKVPSWTCEKHGREFCVECYCSRDAEIAFRAVDMFQSQVNDLGGELKNTLASTAMDLFRRSFMKRAYKVPFQYRNDYCRGAYYGGRVEPFVLGKVEKVTCYDFTSLYPSVMFDYEYPDPDFLHGPITDTTLDLIMEKEGVSDVTVYVPKMPYPPLPFRGATKLYFPTGQWRGHYAHVELRHALECGCKIKDVHTSVYSDKSCRPFTEFIPALFDLRLDLKAKNDPRQVVVKILMNSLYGKFGQRMGAGLADLLSGEQYIRQGTPKGLIPLIIDNTDYYIRAIDIPDQPAYINVPWAAYIAAYARIVLHQAMLQAAPDLYYVDTDSLYVKGWLPTSDRLGDLKVEHQDVGLEIYGPKLYRLTEKDGSVVTKAKGVPRAYQKAFLETGKATYVKPLRFLEAVKRKMAPSVWVTITKERHAQVDKRRYGKAPAGDVAYQSSRPLSVKEIDRVKELPLDEYLRQVNRASLQDARLVPHDVVFKFWDYVHGTFRRVRNKHGLLVPWSAAQADDIAVTLGFQSSDDLMDAIQEQVHLDERVKALA